MFIIKEVGTAAECADRKGVSAASAYSISRQKSADWQLTDKRHSNPRQSSSPPVKGKIKVSFMGTTNLDSLTSKGSVNYMALSLLLDSFFILFFTNRYMYRVLHFKMIFFGLVVELYHRLRLPFRHLLLAINMHYFCYYKEKN